MSGGTTRTRLATDERRRQIFAAARTLFSGRPYGTVSMADIAAAAGVTRGLVNHYFGTKRQLYLDVVQDVVGGPVVPLPTGTARASGRGGDDPWEQGVDAWMKMVESDQEAWFAAIDAGETGADRAMRQILDRARDRTAAQVVEALGLDPAKPGVPSLVRAYGRFAEEVTREWLDRRRITRAQARTMLLRALPLLAGELLPEMGQRRPSEATGL